MFGNTEFTDNFFEQGQIYVFQIMEFSFNLNEHTHSSSKLEITNSMTN